MRDGWLCVGLTSSTFFLAVSLFSHVLAIEVCDERRSHVRVPVSVRVRRLKNGLSCRLLFSRSACPPCLAPPQLVELKNGETYNGHLATCDTWMNLHLQEVVCTSRDGTRFTRLRDCYLRGSTIKYLRIPEPVLEKAKEENEKGESGSDRMWVGMAVSSWRLLPVRVGWQLCVDRPSAGVALSPLFIPYLVQHSSPCCVHAC